MKNINKMGNEWKVEEADGAEVVVDVVDEVVDDVDGSVDSVTSSQ